MDARRRPLLQLTAAFLLAAQFVNVAPGFAAPAPARPAATSARPGGLVTRAQGYYRDARYDEAVGLLSGPILRKELSGDELREARIVLARCYVKKGMTARAKEHFGAILAADPTFVLDATRADAEELAVFRQVKGVPAPVVAKPASPETRTPAPPPPTPTPTTPQLHKPTVAAASESKPSWLSRNKYLAIAVVAGGGVVAGLAMGGGGGGSSAPPGPGNLGGFPAPPGGH